jgi:hypothetical protein
LLIHFTVVIAYARCLKLRLDLAHEIYEVCHQKVNEHVASIEKHDICEVSLVSILSEGKVSNDLRKEGPETASHSDQGCTVQLKPQLYCYESALGEEKDK